MPARVVWRWFGLLLNAVISNGEWRMAQCAAHDVQFAFNTWAEVNTVTDEQPDVVIIQPCRQRRSLSKAVEQSRR